MDFHIGGGTFSQVASQSLLDQKRKQYPTQYTATDFKSQFGKRVHDCVGLIKGYLWRDENDKLTYNASQDKDVSGFYQNCSEVGNIQDMPEVEGLLVFMKGHVGVYIGKGEVIEARGHKFGVIKTKLSERPWTSYGKLKWIKYEEEKKEMLTLDEALIFLHEKGLLDKTEHWKYMCENVKDLKFVFIKWANSISAYNTENY